MLFNFEIDMHPVDEPDDIDVKQMANQDLYIYPQKSCPIGFIRIANIQTSPVSGFSNITLRDMFPTAQLVEVEMDGEPWDLDDEECINSEWTMDSENLYDENGNLILIPGEPFYSPLETVFEAIDKISEGKFVFNHDWLF